MNLVYVTVIDKRVMCLKLFTGFLLADTFALFLRPELVVVASTAAIAEVITRVCRGGEIVARQQSSAVTHHLRLLANFVGTRQKGDKSTFGQKWIYHILL